MPFDIDRSGWSHTSDRDCRTEQQDDACPLRMDRPPTLHILRGLTATTYWAHNAVSSSTAASDETWSSADVQLLG